MEQTEKRPYMPTEFHVATITDERGKLGILTIQTTEGRLDIALDHEAADAVVNAIDAIHAMLWANESCWVSLS